MQMLEILAPIDINTVIITVATSVITFITTRIKKIYNEKVTNETIREVIQDCVKYVEQKAKTEGFLNKYDVAKQKALKILESKKISITDDEIDLLIESFVNCLNNSNSKNEEAYEECKKQIKR